VLEAGRRSPCRVGESAALRRAASCDQRDVAGIHVTFQEMRTWLTLVGFVVYLSGCSSRVCCRDATCRAARSGSAHSRHPMRSRLAGASASTRSPTRARRARTRSRRSAKCGVNLTCDQLEANDCAAESSAVTAACNDLGGGDAGVADARMIRTPERSPPPWIERRSRRSSAGPRRSWSPSRAAAATPAWSTCALRSVTPSTRPSRGACRTTRRT